VSTSPATPSWDLPTDAERADGLAAGLAAGLADALAQSLAALPSDPLAVARRWPTDRPLLMLISGRRHARWSRWTILAAAPTTTDGWLRIEHDDPDPLARLRAAGVGHGTNCTANDGTNSAEAAQLGWIGWISYEFGRAIEPAVRRAANAARPSVDGGDWPLLELARCDAMLVHDGETGRWHARGDTNKVCRIVESLAPADQAAPAQFEIGATEEIVDPVDWVQSVATTVELIRAGDLFQANITRPLRVRVNGDARSAGLALLERAEPWHGALLELPGGRSLVSLSPELFLDATLRRPHGEGDVDGHSTTGCSATGQIVTRPIKGTRPATVDAAELRDSPKDLAELVMIVDLMRNDLGRVCEIGSVRVSEPRVIESHPTIHHGVATIEGRLRAGVDFADLLAATFPPGSITGAPKIRAMQVIESLEPHARGPYCGAIGLIGDDGSVRLNVAIRTLALAADPADSADASHARHSGIYGVGCGIVSESDPEAEYRESLDKARVVQDQCRSTSIEPLSPPRQP